METQMFGLSEVKVTPRDEQVLDLLVQGCRNKEIAGQFSIRTRTVKQHFTNAFSACRDPGWSQELA
jgi:DNA-binding NarL/FixJ family response regulator